MEYNKIIAVTGLPGLYELLSSKTDGAIVRSLDDKSTRFVSSRIHNFSHLESIEVYTVRDNVNLVDVLKAMEASSEKLPDEKDNSALKNYFSKVYPDLDFDRVYSSDLKKMVKWFHVLKSNNVEIKLSQPIEEETSEVAEPEQPEEKPAPKKPKKAAEEKATAKAEEPAREKPAAKKKEAEAGEEKPAAKASSKKTARETAGEKASASVKKTAKEKEETAAADKPKKTTKKKSE
jgi:hypothetical protein